MNQDDILRQLLAHRGMLIGYLTSILRDPDLAEDIFQDVAILVLRKRKALTDPAGFAPWARRIARFEALNASRKRKHAPCTIDDGVLEALEPHWQATDAEPHDAVQALRDCLQRLTPRAQRLVQLRYSENLSGQPLADKLTQPLNTVYVALSRVHRNLAECVKLRLAREGHRHV